VVAASALVGDVRGNVWAAKEDSAMKRLFIFALVVGCIGFVAQGDIAVLGDDGFQLPEMNGDVNRDGLVDLSDAVYLLQWMYAGGATPWPLACEPFSTFHNGDVNGSGEIDISDPIYILQFKFLGGPAPVDGCPHKL
jgi:hypothetical protein